MRHDEVSREIEVPASSEEVWDALTDPERLAEWLAGDALIELRPGGELAMHMTDGERRTGWVEASDPPRRLCFWWAAEGADPTRVELELEQRQAGTLVRVTESRPLARLDLQAAQLTSGGGGASGPVACAGAGRA